MKYKNREEMREKAIQLYLENKKYDEIGKILNCSRNYASKLIRNSEKVIEKKNTKILKVTKNKNKKNLRIGINLLNEIGINNNSEIDEYVKATVDRINKQIIIKKYEI